MRVWRELVAVKLGLGGGYNRTLCGGASRRSLRMPESGRIIPIAGAAAAIKTARFQKNGGKMEAEMSKRDVVGSSIVATTVGGRIFVLGAVLTLGSVLL